MNSPGRGTSVLAGAGPSPPQPSPKPSPHRCEGPVQPLGRSCLQVAQRSLGQAGQSSGPWHRPAPPLHTTGAAARGKQHLEVVFAVLPAFKLQMGAEPASSHTHSSVWSEPQAEQHPLRYPPGGAAPPKEASCRKCEQQRGRGGAERRLQRGSSLEAGGQGAGGGRWPAVCCSNRPGVLAPVPAGWEG